MSSSSIAFIRMTFRSARSARFTVREPALLASTASAMRDEHQDAVQRIAKIVGDERQVFVALLLQEPQLRHVPKHDDRQRDVAAVVPHARRPSTRGGAARRSVACGAPRSP